jgi:hypothetical protein
LQRHAIDLSHVDVGMDVCVAGCGQLRIDYKKKEVRVAGKTIKEGDWISIDGFTGEVFEGKVPTKPSEVVQVLTGELGLTDPARLRRRTLGGA